MHGYHGLVYDINNLTFLFIRAIIDKIGLRLGNGKYCTLRLFFNQV